MMLGSTLFLFAFLLLLSLQNESVLAVTNKVPLKVAKNIATTTVPTSRKSNVKSISAKSDTLTFTYVQQTRPLLNLTTITEEEAENLKPSLDFLPDGTTPQHKFAGRGHVAVSSQIINGSSATKNQFPWQVAIIQDLSFFCGGSVITKTTILTAGHCCFRRTSFDVYLGSTNYKDELSRIAFTTTTKFIHKNYSQLTLNNDICVLRLNRPGIAEADFISGKVRPIRLPSLAQANNTFENDKVTVSGWGKTSDSSGINDTLSYVQLDILSNAVCAKSFGTRIVISSVICTSGFGFKGICSGDSGGPMVILEDDLKYTQIGIVSFGAALSCSNSPSGYTRITSFLGWISQTCAVAIRN